MTSVLRRSARAKSVIVLIAVIATVFGALVALAPQGANAHAASTTGALPTTVSDDALPTVQANGVVWSQVTVGNTVYATGKFTETWPGGTTATSTNQTARSNLLAYDITTGNLITSFNHSLNAQGLDVTASPDGKTVYVVGDFTTVDGVTRNHIAAFDTTTGNLTSFAPSISGSTHAVAVTGSTVYAGGNFSSVGGVARTRLAAFSTTGALLSWAPTADDNEVDALVVSPDGSRVVIGGRFTTINQQAAVGLGAVDATSGASVAFAANNTIKDGTAPGITNVSCGITSLETDGSLIYGTGFSFNCGNLEGRFAADPTTGAISFVNDCHGDTYSAMPIGNVLYSVGHAHACDWIGAFPETPNRTWHKALAETTYATGTDTGPDSYGWNYSGVPDSTQLDWYPTLADGTATGQDQAAWSVTGNSNYVALGGEFPSVNGTAQSGLTRFAVRSIAPNKVGPQVAGTAWNVSATSLASGSVRVSFPSNWDPDDASLTYKVYRDTTASSGLVATTTGTSSFYNLPGLNVTDTGLTQGSTHQYKVLAIDPYGNQVASAWVTATVNGTGTPATSAYAKTVLADGAGNFWRLSENSGTTAYDYAGADDMTENNGVTQGAAGSVAGDPGTASTFDGSNQFAATNRQIVGPNTFSLEGWFKTTSTGGGVIAGFGNSNTALSTNYDRHIYLDAAGHVYFGVYNNGVYNVGTSNTYNDGTWHYVVGTLSSAGVNLYVDGKLIGTNPGTTTGQAYSGYWRIGGDSVGGWPNSGNSYFSGSIDDVAVYPTALSAAQVSSHYTGQSLTKPVPAFTSSANNLAASFDASGSTASAAITGYAWDFGDGGSGTGVKPNHTYASAGTYTVKLTVTDANGSTATVSHAVTVSAPNQPPTASFTSNCSGATCSFDASGSSDPDGTVASYAWTFGDGSSGTGKTVSHTYTAAGTDTVTLTITDNSGATATRNATVSPTAVYANDAFQRTVATGWGTADTTGGAWAAGSGSSVLSVSPGAGTLTLPKAGAISSAYLSGVSTTDSDTTAVVTAPTNASSGMYVDVLARRVSSTVDYRARVHLLANGTVGISLLSNAGGTQTAIKGETVIKGLTFTPGTTSLSIRVQATGSGTSTVRAMVWATGTTAPTAWQVSTTDTTAALQAAGSVGVSGYLPSAATNAPLTLKFASFTSQSSGA